MFKGIDTLRDLNIECFWFVKPHASPRIVRISRIILAINRHLCYGILSALRSRCHTHRRVSPTKKHILSVYWWVVRMDYCQRLMPWVCWSIRVFRSSISWVPCDTEYCPWSVSLVCWSTRCWKYPGYARCLWMRYPTPCIS